MLLLQHRTGRKSQADRLFCAKDLLSLLASLVLALAGGPDPAQNFRKARDLQNSGNCALAFPQYTHLLEETPSDEPELISLIELHMGECLWALHRLGKHMWSSRNRCATTGATWPCIFDWQKMLLAGGESAEALEHANIVLRSERVNVEALSLIATDLINSGREPQAKAILTHILEIDRGQVNAALTLAEMYAREGQPDMAREVLHAVAVMQPRDAKPWLARGRLEEIAGNAHRRLRKRWRWLPWSRFPTTRCYSCVST